MFERTSLRYLLPAVAYGDAAGLPFEGAQPALDPPLLGLAPVHYNPFIGERPKGTWSDDTHLTLAVMLSFVRARGFNLNSQAALHVEAYQHTLGSINNPDLKPPILTEGRWRSWGPSTTKSVARLADGVHPSRAGSSHSRGNGALMKLSPVIAWQLARRTPAAQSEEQIVAFTKLTRAAPGAAIVNLTYAESVKRVASGQMDWHDVMNQSSAIAAHYEDRYGEPAEISDLLGRIATSLSVQSDAVRIVEVTPDKGFQAPGALARTLGLLALQTAPGNILTAAALGGDSDTVAAIVAGGVVLTGGGQVNPSLWPDYGALYDRKRLERISEAFQEVALN